MLLLLASERGGGGALCANMPIVMQSPSEGLRDDNGLGAIHHTGPCLADEIRVIN